MKIFRNIFIYLFVAVAFVGCSETPASTDIEIQFDPTKRYIHFDTGISTRGNLVTGNILQADFAVLGYKYRGDWNTVKPMASPDVFPEKPEIVRYNEGYYTYKNIQSWTGNQYSFFGFYPAEHENIKLFDGDGNIKTGDPYIIYEFPSSANPTTHIDVMTAAFMDTNVNSSPTVIMNMRHRLACVDIGARNYYEFDHDSDPNTPKIPVTIRITELKASYDNVIYNRAKIYLDPSRQPEYFGKSSDWERTYMIVGNETWAPDYFDVKPNSSSDTEMRFVTSQSGDNASSLLLIPQDSILRGTSTLKYEKRFKNDNGDWENIPNIDKNGVNTGNTFETPLKVDFNQPLKEGRRYYMQMTFTSEAVSINIVAADEWNELDNDIKHEFE